MVAARAIERRLWTLTVTGRASARLSVAGFEAVQVAAAAALEPGVDWVAPYHRDLALRLALGITPLDVMLGVLGRAADPATAGRQPPGYGGSRPGRILTTSAVVGAHVTHAAGIAYASKLRGAAEVTLVTIGERGVDTGDWHEGMNFAGVHALPLVCLVEDDATAPAGPAAAASELIALRAGGYGMAGESFDGGDFQAAFRSIGSAVTRARDGGGPSLLHARIPGLSSLGSRGRIRPREQLEAAAAHDPIDRMRRWLGDAGLLDATGDEQVQRDSVAVVEAALEQALAAPAPEAARALDNVFQERAGHA